VEIEYSPFSVINRFKRVTVSHPDRWEELTPRQLIIAASVLNGTVSDERVIELMTGLQKKIIRKLSPYQKLSIIELLRFLNDFTPYHEFIIPSIGHLLRPKPRLKDETFGCFIFAETYFIKYQRSYEDLDLCRFIACYYRSGKFHESKIEKQAEFILRQREDIRQAIYINYILIRQCLSLNYPYVFSPSDEEPARKNQSSWLDVFDAIVKDDIVRQKEYAELPISSVLRYLNNQIKNSRK
jgi:hypothetical protein